MGVTDTSRPPATATPVTTGPVTDTTAAASPPSTPVTAGSVTDPGLVPEGDPAPVTTKWWEIGDLEERQRAYVEQDIPFFELPLGSEERRKAQIANYERNEYLRAKRVRQVAQGKFCSKCGERIGDTAFRYRPVLEQGYGGTVVHSRPSLQAEPVCGECVPEWLPELETRAYTIRMYSHKEPCLNCGREVVFVGRSDENTSRVYCCDDCRDADKSKKRQVRRVGIRLMECEICGEEFKARRSDSKTCSPACRQKAYRQRKKVAG